MYIRLIHSKYMDGSEIVRKGGTAYYSCREIVWSHVRSAAIDTAEKPFSHFAEFSVRFSRAPLDDDYATKILTKLGMILGYTGRVAVAQEADGVILSLYDLKAEDMDMWWLSTHILRNMLACANRPNTVARWMQLNYMTDTYATKMYREYLTAVKNDIGVRRRFLAMFDPTRGYYLADMYSTYRSVLGTGREDW